MLNLRIVIGSTRDGCAADRVVPWPSRRVEARETFTTEIVDLREWGLPMFAETVQTVGDFSNPTHSQPLVRQWNETMRKADAFVFLTPKYNHSVPGVLKNAIDNLFFSFALRNKPGAIWVRHYRAGGLADRSHRPASCPHQIPAETERWCVSCGDLIRGLSSNGPPTTRSELHTYPQRPHLQSTGAAAARRRTSHSARPSRLLGQWAA